MRGQIFFCAHERFGSRSNCFGMIENKGGPAAAQVARLVLQGPMDSAKSCFYVGCCIHSSARFQTQHTAVQAPQERISASEKSTIVSIVSVPNARQGSGSEFVVAGCLFIGRSASSWCGKLSSDHVSISIQPRSMQGSLVVGGASMEVASVFTAAAAGLVSSSHVGSVFTVGVPLHGSVLVTAGSPKSPIQESGWIGSGTASAIQESLASKSSAKSSSSSHSASARSKSVSAEQEDQLGDENPSNCVFSESVLPCRRTLMRLVSRLSIAAEVLVFLLDAVFLVSAFLEAGLESSEGTTSVSPTSSGGGLSFKWYGTNVKDGSCPGIKSAGNSFLGLLEFETGQCHSPTKLRRCGKLPSFLHSLHLHTVLQATPF